MPPDAPSAILASMTVEELLALRAPEAAQVRTLNALLARAARERDARAAPIVVFDLDDTLLQTDHRHVRILREFAAQPEVRGRSLEDAWKLAQLEPGGLRYAIADTARLAGVSDETVLAELRSFWFARFFKNDYLRADAPVPGGPQFCRDAAEAGAVVVYMTGRDEGMREGTEWSLRRHGFPVPDGAAIRLILKPRFDTPDLEFKTEALRRIEEMGEVVGSFENEPAHINLFHGAFPRAINVFVDTKHSGKPVEPHPAIPWIKDFRRS